MQDRPDGFLAKENIDHESEPFQYIQDLHGYLWRFVRAEMPWASGRLDDFIDEALTRVENRAACNDNLPF